MGGGGFKGKKNSKKSIVLGAEELGKERAVKKKKETAGAGEKAIRGKSAKKEKNRLRGVHCKTAGGTSKSGKKGVL